MTIESQEFHELCMDYRAAIDAQLAYEALIKHIDDYVEAKINKEKK